MQGRFDHLQGKPPTPRDWKPNYRISSITLIDDEELGLREFTFKHAAQGKKEIYRLDGLARIAGGQSRVEYKMYYNNQQVLHDLVVCDWLEQGTLLTLKCIDEETRKKTRTSKFIITRTDDRLTLRLKDMSQAKKNRVPIEVVMDAL